MAQNSNTDILIAGAFAAFTVDLLVYPLDTIKTRMQSPDYARLYTNQATGALNKPAMFRGLYQGIGSVIIATLPASGAFFTTYEGTRSLLSRANAPSSSMLHLPAPLVNSAASAFAELVSCAILTPAEVIKQNAQMVDTSSKPSSSQKPPSANATMQTLARFRSQPLALWRGYGALAGRNLPFTALQFPMFESFKVRIQDWRRAKRGLPTGAEGDKSDKDMPLHERGLVTGLAAGSAGSIAAVITTPIDVVKTRIMLSAAGGFAKQPDGASSTDMKSVGSAAKAATGAAKDAARDAVEAIKSGKIADALDNAADSSGKRQSSLAIARAIIADKGYKGLWRGGALRAVWTFLGSGLYLGVYESGRVWLKRGRGGDGDE